MRHISGACLLALGLVGCGEQVANDKQQSTAAEVVEQTASIESSEISPGSSEAAGDARFAENVYFGNFHVHTSYSFDALTNGANTTPADAYRWAKGEAIPAAAAAGAMQIKRPLDFYAVSDHSEYLGVFKKMQDPENPASKLPIAKEILSKDKKVAFDAYARVLDTMTPGMEDPALADPAIMKPIWQEVIRTADEYYEPGKFTTFPAFEWTSTPAMRNLHRVVVFETSVGVPELPFSTNESEDPQDLWKYMDRARANGATVLAISHNGNASDGLMFPTATADGEPLSAEYIEARIANEPLYEVSQIKGSSETHPSLSPNDEFADFELWDYLLAASVAAVPENKKGGYARQAYLDGLSMADAGRSNPYKFGLIGDSDTHNAAASVEEDNHTGKFGFEATAQKRLDGPLPGDEVNNRRVREFSSGGLAAVWAPENTREAIYAALMRKETYATSGTRMKLRFFGGWNFNENSPGNSDWVAQAYRDGVPMGGDLPASEGGKVPVFLISAMKDSAGANLDRIQVVKGWVANGEQHEEIFDVALSDGRTLGDDGKVPPVGNTVDPETATYTNDIGDSQLTAVWRDDSFKPDQYAFYYVRVLEIPTPRWSTYDAKVLGRKPREDLPVSIQERAWSSPIWYTPESRYFTDASVGGE
ncbi:DUF3604 domain-containing protein [Microbulbifer bruguierae]|uniref:DUF3604 domain-containing protein n=1 Tax=Microbulbifer bruguierae TaxID=3029061 RepID=A0ABY8NFC7_9GAMM|nr:DUF3604 domain-containing protein [Microbulbifer bruguierae]WGL17639.1 DUF3604 domain-containing protein [Microbulbifer bruguierae]